MSKIATNKTKIKHRIEELEQQSALIRKEIEGDLEVSKHKLSNFGKILLGIGSGLIFSAIVLGLIFTKQALTHRPQPTQTDCPYSFIKKLNFRLMR